MTTTENTRPGVWISMSAVGTGYVRISADIPNDRLAEATRALAAFATPITPKEGMPSGAARSRAALADDDARARSDQPTVEPAQVEAQHTKIEALLEEAVELLKSIALSVMPPVFRFSGTTSPSGRLDPEDWPRGVWAIPTDETHGFFAGTKLADEDACRRADDVDQDGPDCEGPEGGESA